MTRYNPKDIEPKWQKIWDNTGVYTADLKSDKNKYIAMSMFNYPSGAGIHIGHAMNYTISDVKARFKRQRGYESYHPVGWDSFGLPAENYAIKAGVSPQASMAKIIPEYHKQYKAMGWSNDWSKEIATHEPEYYKWTQWIFSQMYKNDLAYQDSRMQWWCNKCQTVLANEQVIDGKCWRHDHDDDPLVEKKEVKQWFFKITDYADELLDAIEDLDWTESVKLAQKNWIGRSVGAEITFKIDGTDEAIPVFTTRPDTLFGATFMVLAPEHELVKKVTTKSQQNSVEEYVKEAEKKTEVERQASKQKTGVFTGAYAINPVNDKKVPIWVADYVLMGYGTGAIMAVPAHDERDHEFAQEHGIDITNVIDPVSIREDSKDKTEFVKKKKIVAFVEDENGNVLTINWGPKLGGRLLIGGTVENDESPEQTALREVKEETGYDDLEIKEVGDETYFYKYYAFSKQTAYSVECKFVHILLKSSTNSGQKLDDSEKDNFKVELVPSEIANKEIVEPLHRYTLDKFLNRVCYTGEGLMANSGKYNGLSSSEAREKIVADLASKGRANERVNYKMRDWSVSRQRYWGAPIPIIHCDKCGNVLVEDKDLPVVLPELKDFQPSGDGRSALARAKEWLNVDCPKCGGPAERETDTLDTYICSSWYMLRYFDPHNSKEIFDSKIVKKWEPIDFYNGADHATAHLLYARFMARFFTKQGLIDNPEPFKQFLFNGKVTASDGTMFSKSKGNGVDPLDIISQGYGADALRTYLMFAAPLELWVRWDPQGVPGTYRFLSRIWTLVQEYLEAKPGDIAQDKKKQLQRTTHSMIKKMTADLQDNSYNTAIAAAMTAVNELYKLKEPEMPKNDAWKTALEHVVACVAPFAPHIADELWQQLGHRDSVQVDSWPQWDDKMLEQDEITIVVQVNGKVRSQLRVPTDADEKTVAQAAKADQKVASYLERKTIKKQIFVAGRLINFVV